MIGRKRLALWAGGGVLALGAATAGAIALVSPSREADSKRLSGAARALGQAVAWTLDQAPGRTRPQRCALAEPRGAVDLEAGKHAFSRKGRTLAAPGRGLVILGVVADARGSTEPTLAAARALKAAFVEANVHVVLSLGGMGESKEEIAAVLGALVDKRWLLAAIAGDRERAADHAAAVAELAAKGWPVVDASTLEALTVGDIVLAPLPGVAIDGWGLVAGPEGCGRAGEEVARVPKATVVFAHAPPRQTAKTATDLARGDLHVGDPAVTMAATKATARLVLHGLVDEAAGRVAEGIDRTVAAAGSLEGGPVAGLVVEIDGPTYRPRVRAIPRGGSR